MVESGKKKIVSGDLSGDLYGEKEKCFPSSPCDYVRFLTFFLDMRSFDCLNGWLAHEGEICSMQFSADETAVYSMGTDGKV